MIDPVNVRFRELRKALGLNTTQLGDAIGLSNSGISCIEAGQRKVSDKHIKLLKVAFPLMSEHWLRTGEGEMFEEPQDDIDRICEAYGFGDIARAAMHEFVRLTPEHQQLITDYVRATVERYLRDAAPAASGPPEDPDLTPDVLAELDRADALLNAQQDEPPARDA